MKSVKNEWETTGKWKYTSAKTETPPKWWRDMWKIGKKIKIKITK